MIENDIIGALEENQLAVFVQPKVDMRNGRIIGGEALVRWLHPERGRFHRHSFYRFWSKTDLL